MKRIVATRKGDEIYYQGPFWIISDSFKDIHRGNFELLGEHLASDWSGNYVDNRSSKSQKTHKKLWDRYKLQFNDVDYTFYPRGRVAIYEGTAFIHLNSRCNVPQVIDAVIQSYELDKLEIEVDLNDTYQGSHYDFQLK